MKKLSEAIGFLKSIAFFLAIKQENRKGSAIGLRQKTFYTLVCKGKRGDFYGVFELILRIGLSILPGFFIGLERQITGHPAGRSKTQTAESIVSRLLTVPSVVRAGWELL